MEMLQSLDRESFGNLLDLLISLTIVLEESFTSS